MQRLQILSFPYFCMWGKRGVTNSASTFYCHKQLYSGAHIQDWTNEPAKLCLNLRSQLHMQPNGDSLEL